MREGFIGFKISKCCASSQDFELRLRVWRRAVNEGLNSASAGQGAPLKRPQGTARSAEGFEF